MNYSKRNHLYTCINHAIKSIIYSSVTTLSLTSLTSLAQSENLEEVNKVEETDEIEEVIVTGSRIRTDGMNSSNPVTVVTIDEILLLNPASVVDGLAQLPQFMGSYTNENFGFSFFESPGAGTLSLRGLQGKRTLSLLDGKRIVASTIFGGADVNLFPMQLLQTVESVTGGATAAYGTDAVAGAVNFILNKKFEGFNANIQAGVTEDGKFKNNGFSLAGGFALTEKVHVLLSAGKNTQDQEMGRSGFDWYEGTRYIDNPSETAGESRDNPLLIPAPQVVSRTDSLDGIIFFPAIMDSFGVTNPARESFVERYGSDRFILDPDGNASPFVNGSYSDEDQNSLVGGGSGTVNDEFSRQFMPKSERENYFAYIDYDLTEQLNIYFEGMYGKSSNRTSTTFGSNLTGAYNNTPDFFSGAPTQAAPYIYSGNPYIPANIQQIMDDENIPYITIGKTSHPSDLDRSFQQQDTETLSLNVGFDYKLKTGGFFDDWLLKGYYQSGKTDVEATQGGYLRQDRIYLAYDAIVDPDNPDNIICNVSQYLSAPENAGAEGCLPYNPFGRGQANEAAIDWVTDYEAGVPYSVDGYFINEHGEYDPIHYEYTGGEYKKRVIDIQMDNWELSLDGVLSEEGLGSGPVSMAIGYASRKESFTQVVQAPGVNPSNDPNASPPPGINNPLIGRRGISGAIANSYQDLFYSNVPFAKGKYQVDEAFVEFLLPLLSDISLINKLDVGLAGRWANYKQIDKVTSWKASFTWEMFESLRFRGTISQDVRAPTMAERYDRTGGIGSFLTDHGIKDNCGAFDCFVAQVLKSSYGSLDLKPEEAKTFTLGFVYRPQWLEGLSYSMDYYHIKIDDNIEQLGPQGVIDGCYLDNIDRFCDLIVRDGPPTFSNPALNSISFIFDPYINRDFTESSGVDFEVSYNTEVNVFGGGENLGVRFLGSYLNEQIYSTDGVEVDYVDFFWAPWTANLSANYNRGPLSVSLQTRYGGTLPVDRTYNQYSEEEGRIVWNVTDNENKEPMYVTANIAYNFELKNGSHLNLSLNIGNLFDKSPDIDPNNFSGDGVRGNLRGRNYNLRLGFNY